MSKIKRNFQSSRQRQIRALENARLVSNDLPPKAEVFIAPPPSPEAAKPTTKERIPMTFNWEGSENSPIFHPNLLQSGELTNFRGPLLTLVNHTATGAELPDGLKKDLRKYSGDEIGDAISEGIKRWHSHGQERK